MSICPPKVAVGLPVYNGETYLAQAIEAILSQRYSDLELILVDNASTDATEAICRNYASQDRRVRYVRNARNIGSVPNFNKAFALANSPFFKWAAHDDLLHDDYLAQCVEALEATPSAALAHAHVQLIDDDGRPLPHDAQAGAFITPRGDTWRWNPRRLGGLEAPDPIRRFETALYERCAEWLVYGVFRRPVLQQTRLFLLYGEEDMLMAEVLLRGHLAVADAPLFYQRVHAGSARYMNRRECYAYQMGLRTDAPRLPSWPRAVNFVRAVLQAPLPPQERLRGLAALLRYALRPESLRNALVPGPTNYWGLDFSRQSRQITHPRHQPTPSQPASTKPTDRPSTPSCAYS